MSSQGIPFKRIDKQYDNAPSVTSKLDGKQKAIFALLNLQDYVNGLIIQWNRIISAEEARFRRSDHGSSYWLAATAIDLDIHYYVICWDKIEKNRKQLMSIIRQKEIGIAWREVKNVLTKVGDLRNFYEHLDQRTIQARGIQLTSN